MDPQYIQRLGIAMVLSALLGIDRALSSERGGMLTHALMGVGACLCHQADQGSTIMAAAVLASATMFKSEEAVRGINTAATVWVAAGIGAACADGHVILPAAAAVLCMVAQGINRAVLRWGA